MKNNRNIAPEYIEAKKEEKRFVLSLINAAKIKLQDDALKTFSELKVTLNEYGYDCNIVEYQEFHKETIDDTLADAMSKLGDEL